MLQLKIYILVIRKNTLEMYNYKYFVLLKYARSRDIPLDIVVDPFPTSIREIVEAAKNFYSLWYGNDWHEREVKRVTGIPYHSSYENVEDAELWLVVGSPTRGLILVTTDPNTKDFFGREGVYTSGIYIIDLRGNRLVWFTFWKLEAIGREKVIEVRAPRRKKIREKPTEYMYIDLDRGIKSKVIIYDKSRTRVSFTYMFDEDEKHELSDRGFDRIKDVIEWIFKKTEQMYGNKAVHTVEIVWNELSVYIEKLPKPLFNEVIEKLKKIAIEELKPRTTKPL